MWRMRTEVQRAKRQSVQLPRVPNRHRVRDRSVPVVDGNDVLAVSVPHKKLAVLGGEATDVSLVLVHGR